MFSRGVKMMSIENQLGNIEAALSQFELEDVMQKFVEANGFASFCFVDGSTPHLLHPYHVDTDKHWSREYAQQGFANLDPVLAKARRSNVPFSWGSLEIPEQRAQIKLGSIKTMEAALDHGFTEGLVVPFHTVDSIGRLRSQLCTFFGVISLKTSIQLFLPKRPTFMFSCFIGWRNLLTYDSGRPKIPMLSCLVKWTLFHI